MPPVFNKKLLHPQLVGCSVLYSCSSCDLLLHYYAMILCKNKNVVLTSACPKTNEVMQLNAIDDVLLIQCFLINSRHVSLPSINEFIFLCYGLYFEIKSVYKENWWTATKSKKFHQIKRKCIISTFNSFQCFLFIHNMYKKESNQSQDYVNIYFISHWHHSCSKASCCPIIKGSHMYLTNTWL